MANFTDETTVRTKTQLMDSAKVASDLVTQSIGDAHGEILKTLDPIYDVSPADDNLARGETLLAGAYLLRSLASEAAFDLKSLRLQDKSVGETSKWSALLTVAQKFEDEAWEVLGSFMAEQEDDGQFQVGVTETEPVIGKDEG